MTNPKVSIIIPAFNAASTIGRCIGSIIHQSLRDIEIIVVDDCSTDETPRLLSEFDKQHRRLKIIRSNENKSASYSRKVGALASTGRYIMFVDADDQLEKDACKIAYQAIEAKQVDILQFGVNVKGVQVTAAQIEWFNDFLSYKSKDRITGSLLRNCFEKKVFGFTIWNKIYKADLVRIASLYIPDTPIYKAQDLLLQFFILTYALSIDAITNSLYTYSYGSGITGGRKFTPGKVSVHMSQAIIIRVIYDFLVSKNLLEAYGETIRAIAYRLMSDNLNTVRICTGSALECQSKTLFLQQWGDGATSRGETFDPNLASFLMPVYKKIGSNPIFQTLHFQGALVDTNPSIRDQIDRVKKSILDKQEDCIPIVMASNEAYIPYLAVAIESIKAHTSTSIFLFVFYTDLCSESIKRVKFLSNDKLHIELINVSSFIDVGSLYTKAHYSIEMYYRLIIPEIFPFLHKVLYLDCDIVTLSDLSDLFKIDLGSNILAAARNTVHRSMASYLKDRLQHDYKKYFNSGVIIINIEQFIRQDIKHKCLAFLSSNDSLVCPDQDALNVVCNGSVRFIDLCWNFQWHHGLSATQERKVPELLDDEKQSYYISRNNIKILHYTSNIKPWNEPSQELADYFWDFAKQSPFFLDVLKANINRTR